MHPMELLITDGASSSNSKGDISQLFINRFEATDPEERFYLKIADMRCNQDIGWVNCIVAGFIEFYKICNPSKTNASASKIKKYYSKRRSWLPKLKSTLGEGPFASAPKNC